jgi:tyrosyl-tRNA synthetase
MRITQQPWQRFLFQETQGASAHLLSEPRTIYMGTDITAPSLHPGHLVPLLMLKAMQDAGHRIIVLLGGATSLIGDPTDRNSQRPLLTSADVSKNINTIKECVNMILGTQVLIVNNADWLSQIRWIDMIRQIGTKISVNKLIKTDTFAKRLESNLPLSFIEICYPLCQAYDFYHLHKEYGCTVQCGASDQWANILAGTNLVGGAFGITCPLLTDSNNRKLSKSTHNTAWLHPSLTTPLELWQYFKNLADHAAIQLIAMLDIQTTPNINDTKSALAEHLTGLIHGTTKAKQATAKANAMFAGDSDAFPVRILHKPSYRLYELVHQAGIVTTNTQGRQLVRQHAVKINNNTISDECAVITLPCTIVVNKHRYRLENQSQHQAQNR